MNAHQESTPHRLARALGWGSLALGGLQLAAPDTVRKLAGVDDSRASRTLVPMAGVRELLHAGPLLVSREPAPWVWTRVAGDVMDLAVLGRALGSRSGGRGLRTGAVTAAVAALTALDVYTAARGAGATAHRRDEDNALEAHAAITINRPRAQVYRFWHDFSNLPRFMDHLESVEPRGQGRSHWRTRGPLKRTVEWDADIVEDRPGKLIAWQSVGRTAVENHGSVWFSDAPGGRGTELRVHLAYEPRAGRLGTAVAKLLGEHPDQQVHDDLRRLKQVLEAGEVVRSEGSPEGTRAMRLLRQRPAQPLVSG
ncbi:SRPBCC family protein [Streptomyces glomeratus]|nr:SRPBCC family protein [Streptomyces glomeratus]MCF1510160.1 SRPBCC family protein [Streptomyces glomeratus]